MRKSLAMATALLAVALTAAACSGSDDSTSGDGSTSTPTTAATSRPIDRGPYGGLVAGEAAPEFVGTQEWFNTAPLTLEGLIGEGQVVLIDFWTYSCVNCQRTLPHVRDWHAKYADRGLTIVGVHTPEFRFEEDADNVREAILEAGIRYPVVQDNDRLTWRAFDNRVWPAKYLIGADGQIFYRHFGEGAYDETEEAIRAALEAAGRDLSDVKVGGLAEPDLDGSMQGMTRELYFGYERNYSRTGVYAAQDEYYAQADTVIEFVDPGPPRAPNVWYAHGRWNNADQAMVHLRDTDTFEDYVTFEFTARAVNPVFSAHSAGATVAVELDGEPLTPEQAGPDVDWDEMGRSVVFVDGARMYRVVELPARGTHTLAIFSRDEYLSLYSVTFGSYVEGP